ncbi:ATP-binding protein [Streptomyces sp. NBC_00083]|uniref:ATP-binding protein n=1 Tax=Streptomyces sp. NBC_00083 TaxID=2975647 RepID=UPI00225AC950|nr:ATP-binding protein [Streptomyces sp. NBC_00083]MCX5384393.1 ATP-binding protein [Streptomyces sp. NBC_00083]
MLTHPPSLESPTPQPSAPRSPSGHSCAHWSLAPTVEHVPLVRARVRAALDRWRIPAEVADALLLVTSELTTNVVRHAAGVTDRLRVTVTLTAGWLRLDVTDGDPVLPQARTPHPGAESGRGVGIVEFLVADARGEMSAHADAYGKTVRVRLPVA